MGEESLFTVFSSIKTSEIFFAYSVRIFYFIKNKALKIQMPLFLKGIFL